METIDVVPIIAYTLFFAVGYVTRMLIEVLREDRFELSGLLPVQCEHCKCWLLARDALMVPKDGVTAIMGMRAQWMISCKRCWEGK